VTNVSGGFGLEDLARRTLEVSSEEDYLLDTAVTFDDGDLVALVALVFYEFPDGDGPSYAFGDGEPLTPD